MRRILSILSVALLAALVSVAGANATVVSVGGVQAGVAPVPGDLSGPTPPLGAPIVRTGPSSCNDPWLASDLRQPGGFDLPPDALCYQGGQVLHANEPFALTWDAPFNQQARHYWESTRGYVEQFLRDVADGTGQRTSPYSITPQYQDGTGRAANDSRYGGGCIDYGSTGGSTCRFGDQSTKNSSGVDYPGSGCVALGYSYAPDPLTNLVCLTDAQIQDEVRSMYTTMGIQGRTQPGHTPVMMVLLPPQVEACLDGASTLCSANSSQAPSQPKLTPATTGGTVAPGTYYVELTYVNGSGETEAGPPQSVTTDTPTSAITIDSPPYAPGATGWYAYVTHAGGGAFYRQQQSGPTAIGSSLTLSAPPSSGPTPPVPTKARFCSYHSYVTVNGTRVPYVVQPWSPFTGCDEPDVPQLTPNMTTEQVEQNAGMRLVSPLSQAHIAAITNPFLNGWWAADGSETNDNSADTVVDPNTNQLVKVGRCVPLGGKLDQVTVGSSSQNPYFLQREFNNAGAIQSDLNSPQCAPWANLIPHFVVPSPINAGDVVAFDGSVTDSTLMVPKAGYHWNFGDGSTATGPSVVHTYKTDGDYTVQLSVTDRGGNTASYTQTVKVGNGSGGGNPAKGLRVHVQLMPQGFSAVLKHGLAVRVRSNQRADGFATLSISRRAARRAHLHTARSGSVVIARGTVSGIRAGSHTLHLRLARASASRLRRLRHVTINLRLTLVGAHGSRVTVDAAGSY